MAIKLGSGFWQDVGQGAAAGLGAIYGDDDEAPPPAPAQDYTLWIGGAVALVFVLVLIVVVSK